MKKAGKALLLMFISLLLCIPVSAATLNISLKKKASTMSTSLTVGENLKLTVKKGKKRIKAAKVKFGSSNVAVASINARGVITAAKPGKAIIKVSAKGCTAKVTVRVKKDNSGTKPVTPKPSPSPTPSPAPKEPLKYDYMSADDLPEQTISHTYVGKHYAAYDNYDMTALNKLSSGDRKLAILIWNIIKNTPDDVTEVRIGSFPSFYNPDPRPAMKAIGETWYKNGYLPFLSWGVEAPITGTKGIIDRVDFNYDEYYDGRDKLRYNDYQIVDYDDVPHIPHLFVNIPGSREYLE